MVPKPERIFATLKRLLWGAVAIILLYVTCDRVIMPLYTRHGRDVAVPDVVGLTYAAAQLKLSQAGFRIVKAGEQFDSEHEPGVVLFQSPEPGAPAKRGRRIYVTVSKGERFVTMPKVVGGSERSAALELSSQGLVLRNIQYVFSTEYLRDVVCDQSIPEGQVVRQGTEVDIAVSLGPAPDQFVVPQLIGKSLAEASKIIERAGLTLGTIRYQTSEKLLPDTVIDQVPAGGSEAVMGQPVDLVVSRLPE
ncbi:MAG: PASTA domain-containing protein [candidate division KSB1 bacterium]|nr:PASTA domain-containing protein [candidate division KSB1 bacterium]MDZ7385737.1 PASTA domain-containing protein [candidate division KSB1 bacterium]MDZ7392125.1 PASTA domain-containing protein [candidate division KSB1 bacterium]MDZ7413824.1 PASTA domain-containing protein [candidate division KSB1 bacterium]